MNHRMIKAILFFALLFFGILVGLDSKQGDEAAPSPKNRFINPDYYIARIEDGKFVFVPITDQTPAVEATTTKNEETISDQKREKPAVKGEGPIMNRKGVLDQMGLTIGSKLSAWTRTALEKSIGLFTD